MKTPITERLINAWLVLSGHTFSPGEPLQPTENEPPRRYDYPAAYNIQSHPRTEDTQPTFSELRNLAELYDVASICIGTRIEQATGLNWSIVAKDSDRQEALKDQCYRAKEFFQYPDHLNDFTSWLTMALYDVLSIDALSIWKKPNRQGALTALEIVDGATIKPLLDSRGRALGYQQNIKGVPYSNYKRAWLEEELPGKWADGSLLYAPRWQRANTPYGHPPTEWVILRINTALRKSTFDLSYFTDGSMPTGIAMAPEDQYSPEQVVEFERMFNAILAGNDAARHKVKFIPYNWNWKELKPYQYTSELDHWMLKITCAAFGVPPSEIGFTDDVNRATSQVQSAINERRGLRPLVEWFSSRVLNPVLQKDLGYSDLKWQWEFGEQEDIKQNAEIDAIYISAGVLTPEQVFQKRFADDFGAYVQEEIAADSPAEPEETEKLQKVGREERDKKERVLARIIRRAYKDQSAKLSAAFVVEDVTPFQILDITNRFDWDNTTIELAQAVLPGFQTLVESGIEEGLTTLKLPFDLSLWDQNIVNYAETEALRFAEEVTDTSKSQVMQLIADWTKEQADFDTLKDRIATIWTGDRADVAAVTETTRVFTRGKMLSWQDSSVKKWEFATAADEMVCPICKPLNKEQFAMDDERNLPPVHPNCRCDVLPIV